MKTANILIKPSSLCNLRCAYCFYADASPARQLSGTGRMNDETMERLVRGAFQTGAPRVVFGFQGGEPTLAGLDFYRRFVLLEKKYRPPGVDVAYTMQTNGVLLDAYWAEFLRENKFLVGLSIDGERGLHNTNRVDTAGKGSYQKAMDALALLQKNGVATNILCVITGASARRALRIYKALKESGCRHYQFIPCLDPQGEPRGKQPYSLTPERYAVFLKTMFDAWYADWYQGEYTSIRLFEDYVHILAGRPPGSCASAGLCGEYLVVESDGAVYPCDFYTCEEWRLGSVRDLPALHTQSSPQEKRFRAEGMAALPGCSACRYAHLCKGGCRRDWCVENGEAANYYCRAFVAFFDYAYERLAQMAAIEKWL